MRIALAVLIFLIGSSEAMQKLCRPANLQNIGSKFNKTLCFKRVSCSQSNHFQQLRQSITKLGSSVDTNLLTKLTEQEKQQAKKIVMSQIETLDTQIQDQRLERRSCIRRSLVGIGLLCSTGPAIHFGIGLVAVACELSLENPSFTFTIPTAFVLGISVPCATLMGSFGCFFDALESNYQPFLMGDLKQKLSKLHLLQQELEK